MWRAGALILWLVLSMRQNILLREKSSTRKSVRISGLARRPYYRSSFIICIVILICSTKKFRQFPLDNIPKTLSTAHHVERRRRRTIRCFLSTLLSPGGEASSRLATRSTQTSRPTSLPWRVLSTSSWWGTPCIPTPFTGKEGGMRRWKIDFAGGLSRRWARLQSITMKCWRMGYESAEQVVQDLEAIGREQQVTALE